MHAFVTGATGLLGNNLVRALVARGDHVRALVRSPVKAARTFGDLPVELVVGDLADVAGFAEEMRGTDVVFHTAAYFREYFVPGDHAANLERINVEGSLAVFRAAKAAGVTKVVHTSSSGVIGPGPDGAPGDESCGPGALSLENGYFRSKVDVEQRIADAIRAESLPVTSVLPGWMYGPGDLGPTSAGKVVLDFLHGKLPVLPPGGGSVVDARDVAEGMIRLAERGVVGDRTLVAGRFATLADVCASLERVSGVRAPRVRVPYPLAFATAVAAETWARWTGTSTSMSSEGLRTLRDGQRLSSAKAERELGLTFRPLDETLADTVAYYRAVGLAPAGRAAA